MNIVQRPHYISGLEGIWTESTFVLITQSNARLCVFCCAFSSLGRGESSCCIISNPLRAATLDRLSEAVISVLATSASVRTTRLHVDVPFFPQLISMRPSAMRIYIFRLFSSCLFAHVLMAQQIYVCTILAMPIRWYLSEPEMYVPYILHNMCIHMYLLHIGTVNVIFN